MSKLRISQNVENKAKGLCMGAFVQPPTTWWTTVLFIPIFFNIGLDLARRLPSATLKNVITERKRLFIHVIVPVCSYFLVSFVWLSTFSWFHRRDHLWCNRSVLQPGVEWEARGRAKCSSPGTPGQDFSSLFLLVGSSRRAAVTSLPECALSFRRLTSPGHWWDGVRHVLNRLKTIIILRPSWRRRPLPFILFQNFCCGSARLLSLLLQLWNVW